MDIDRRKFMVAVAAAAAGCAGGDPSTVPPTPTPDPDPSPVRAPSPEPFAPAASVDLSVFPWGVRVGDPTGTSALLGVHAGVPAVTMVLRSFIGEDWVEQIREQVVLEEGFATHPLVGLAANTSHTVWVEADGVRSDATRFRTAPEPGELRQLVFGATSCLGGNPLTNLMHVGDHDLDFFCMLGDTVYADGDVTLADYRATWDAKLSGAELRALSQATGWMSTWDDHEVSNNWFVGEGGTTLEDAVSVEQLAAATRAFREAIPMGVGPGGTELWRALNWGDLADVFLLDCRGERGEHVLLSEAQFLWIEAALTESTAAFKIVLTSVHVTDHLELMNVIAQEDRWQGYPTQRTRLLQVALQVPGVVFVTGDMHYGAVQRVDPEGGPAAALYEIAAGPSGSNIFPISDVAGIGGGTLPAQYETLVETWSWSRIALDPGTRTVTVQFIGTDGEVLAEQRYPVIS